jgi:uncharacterized phage infection (PIP) family protein YhgE
MAGASARTGFFRARLTGDTAPFHYGGIAARLTLTGGTPMRRFTAFAALIAMAIIPLSASAQFGFGGKKNKFDTKPVKALLSDIDKVVVEYEDGTENVWTATEIVQNTVKAYADGEFPVLTQPWGEIRKAIKEAKDDAAKAAAVELSNKYLKEMAERKKAVEAFMADPVKSADIAGKLQPPEVDQLKKVVESLKPVPEQDLKLIAKAQELSTKAAKSVADLTTQITKNPLKAGDYKKLVDKLNAGIADLNKIPTELQKQMDAITTMVANLDKMLTK